MCLLFILCERSSKREHLNEKIENKYAKRMYVAVIEYDVDKV